jgi:hypothetical protein
MLGMVGHIPHQQADRKAGQRRARVGQAVPVLAASGVLNDQ